MKKNGKSFLKNTIKTVFITLLTTYLIGCSSSDNESVDPGFKETTQSKCLEKGALGLIDSNHGHELTIPKEDVAEAKRKTYSIQGAADHNHTLTVNSEDFTSMKNNSGADIYSSTENDHRHSVIIRCGG